MILSTAEFAELGHTDYHVCIAGAGPAGITLALELAAGGRRVCLLEAGGATYTAAAQRLAEGSIEGDPYPPLRSTRLHALGGSSQVWAGWCRPLDELDFEARPTIDKPGWPFGRAELLPWYQRAHERCGLLDPDYDVDGWSSRLGERPLLHDSEHIAHALFHVRALRFGTWYRQQLERSQHVHVVLHAPVLDVAVDGTDAVRGLNVRLRDGRRIVVRARQYVLAAGGIENARLLLLSADSPERAPGNRHGMVGRFFTDHPFVNAGSVMLREPRRLGLYFPRAAPAVRAVLTLPRAVLEREALAGSALFFHPRYEAHPAFAEPEVRAFLELRDKLRLRAVPGAYGPLLLRAVRGPHRIAVAAVRKLLVRDRPARRWRLRMMFEALPRPDNRVQLDAARHDALGRPAVRVNWRLSDAEVRGMRRSLGLYDHALRTAGVGHVESGLADSDEAWRSALEGGKHHMGTTRMHREPAAGVVDENCRVHGTRNLYVAGSSVFTSSGYANPTLTIVALAIRLADHLNRNDG